MITLPPPATTTELYLAAVLEELQALRADLAQPRAAAPADTVELRGLAPSPAPAQSPRAVAPPNNRRR